jgi:hypothetical protein
MTEVAERQHDLVAHLLVDTARQHHRARLGQRLQAGGDIDRVAKDVGVGQDDVAQMQADAEGLAPPFRQAGVRSAMRRCSSTAERTASTALPNSTITPSPTVLTMRPWKRCTTGATNSARCALRSTSVCSSSACIMRL